MIRDRHPITQERHTMYAKYERFSRRSLCLLPPGGRRLFACLVCATLAIAPLANFTAAEDTSAGIGSGPDVGRVSKELGTWLDAEMTNVLRLYTWLHAHPEVSFEEDETAAKLSQMWTDAGLNVTGNVGGHGIVGILKNGDGPVVMLRTDLDGLPVTENTPVAYASKQTTIREDGSTTGIMHACGHDIHMTSLTTVVRWLTENRDRWSGTLLVIGQPAEERGAGAKAMLEDGLFERFPKPDYALAMHCSSDTATGQIKIRPGYALANVDSVDITMRGRGGHGSAPHTTIDPVVQAAELVMSLQMIVSREISPIEPAVVTVGSIHGGTKHNIIGNDCHLQLTVRSYSQEVREKVLAAIKRRTFAIAQANDAPEPTYVVSEGTPSLRNDDELAGRMRQLFGGLFGSENILEDDPSMGGEDFSRYGIAGVPILMYRVGTVSQARLDRFEKLGIPPASLHSAVYYPDAEETFRVSVPAMITAVLDLMPVKD
ncbi:MAG: amidohydrolase [Rhodopirellula sp. JB044]|uniref:amidohydrolase n=1 Tax=Rhodopirellula sp. JB044 TaxID=3342844 RepID=UPI003709E8AB